MAFQFTEIAMIRSEEQYRKDVHSFFTELQKYVHILEAKYNVGFRTKDAHQAYNEHCCDRNSEYANITRAEVIKEFKDYKQAMKIGMLKSVPPPHPLTAGY